MSTPNQQVAGHTELNSATRTAPLAAAFVEAFGLLLTFGREQTD
jgi:hypothetical protein